MKTNNGSIKISNDILINVAGITALDIEGVTEVCGFDPKSLINDKGISLTIGDEIIIDMLINVDSKHNIPELAKKIQSEVIKQIEVITSLKVNKVNIIINTIE